MSRGVGLAALAAVACGGAPSPPDPAHPSADEVALAYALAAWPVARSETRPEARPEAPGGAVALTVGPHQLIVPGRVWEGELAGLPAPLVATVEPGTPAPRWIALAPCAAPSQVRVVAVDEGEITSRPTVDLPPEARARCR